MESKYKIHTNMIESTQLNYPFYFYPRSPCAGYHNIKLYNTELIRLQKFINDFNSHTKILFHFTIGAAAEEFEVNSKHIEYQWQQLCPIHVQTALKKGIKVVHLIVTPNEYFGGYGNTAPYFMKHCKDLALVQIDDNNFTSAIYDYTCVIFNTMMPTIDTNNKRGCEHVRNIVNKSSTGINVTDYIQTQNDIDFTLEFYSTLTTLTDNIVNNGGISTCFSFAVFNMSTCNSSICNYKMFPSIVKAFYGPRKMLCEWMFAAGCYCVHMNNSDDQESNSICYIQCK